MSKVFNAFHIVHGTNLVFTEDTAPSWLTGEHTVKGSTMDCRWFWTDHVLQLGVGNSIETDYHKITRLS